MQRHEDKFMTEMNVLADRMIDESLQDIYSSFRDDLRGLGPPPGYASIRAYACCAHFALLAPSIPIL